ncbi:MAG TPA: D-aminoacylase [Gammaproteobacteria bacterium]|nr:D-aminoacylase [Gammaproteobacteria bacterium]
MTHFNQIESARNEPSMLLRVKVQALLLIGCVALCQPGQSFAETADYDLLLRNGRIVDGTGNPWYRADVAIRGDTIVLIAPSIDTPATTVIDVGGQVIAPGFIDIHTHAEHGIFSVPTADNYVRQGVTTLIGAPDGDSPVPLGAFLARLDALPKTINIGMFAGQGAVRAAVIGEHDRAATAAELDEMRALVAQAMADGAFGLSTGLFYVPGSFTPTDEVVELAKVAARAGGIHISHMRDEAAAVLDSVRETIAIGERALLPTQVTHHKIVGRPNWGRSTDTLRLVDEARARGVDVTIDLYPYTASSTRISAALFPAWSREGGAGSMRARLEDGATRGRVKVEVARIIRDERGGGDLENVVLARCEWDESLAGKTLADIARLRGLEPGLEAGAEAAIWIVEQGDCQGNFHAMSEEDLERILRHPASMVASDGGVVVFGRAHPHPRSYGTFARVLSEYVRERGVLTLEEAVRKMTSFPAQRLGLPDRGVLRPGFKADVAVFDPARVRDAATYREPHQYAKGFSLVLVNGVPVFDGEAVTGARPGRTLVPGSRT